MSGNKYFLDTNAIISFLQGNDSLKEVLSSADWIGVSVISVLEFLAFPDLSIKDKFIFFNFIERIDLVEIKANDIYFLESLADFKKEYNLKLPDAIIAGYSIRHQSILISNDNDFSDIEKLTLRKF